jgi:hypothetical protein
VGYSASFETYFQQFLMHRLFYVKKDVGLCCAIPFIKPYGAVIKTIQTTSRKNVGSSGQKQELNEIK